MDATTLKDLPIPLAVIVAALYFVNQNNAEFAKKLIGLITEFTDKYEALLEAVTEDRLGSRQRWLERDRILIDALNRNTEAQVRNANETHALRNMVQPLVISVEAERKRRHASAQSSTGGGDGDAAD